MFEVSFANKKFQQKSGMNPDFLMAKRKNICARSARA